MNLLRKIMRIASLVVLGSTTICGLYVMANQDVMSDLNSSMEFHRFIGIAGVVLVTITLFLPLKRKEVKNG